MAGDWIKARVDLHEQPEVIGLASRLKLDADAVVGKLLRFWSWADRVTTDGFIPFVDRTFVDTLARKNGFADALVAVRWLEITDDGLSIPHYDRHNGESAKKRALAAERQRNVRKLSRSERDKSVTENEQPRDQRREEKRREEKEHPPTPRNGGPCVVPIPVSLDSEEFKTAWGDWQRHLDEAGKRLTPTAWAGVLRQLEGWGPHRAVSAIRNSIAAGWKRLIEPAASKTPTARTLPTPADDGLTDEERRGLDLLRGKK